MGTHPIFESDFDCLTEMDNEYWYDIDNKKGDSIKRLLAISIGEFRSESLAPLPSAAVDRERVVRTFSKLKFRPTQEKAGVLTKSDGRKLIMKFREKFAEDKVNTKCLVIYLKSHGGLHHTQGTMIHFSDEAIGLWDLLDPLLQLEQLEGVPKMIIFEACRKAFNFKKAILTKAVLKKLKQR